MRKLEKNTINFKEFMALKLAVRNCHVMQTETSFIMWSSSLSNTELKKIITNYSGLFYIIRMPCGVGIEFKKTDVTNQIKEISELKNYSYTWMEDLDKIDVKYVFDNVSLFSTFCQIFKGNIKDWKLTEEFGKIIIQRSYEKSKIN